MQISSLAGSGFQKYFWKTPIWNRSLRISGHFYHLHVLCNAGRLGAGLAPARRNKGNLFRIPEFVHLPYKQQELLPLKAEANFRSGRAGTENVDTN